MKKGTVLSCLIALLLCLAAAALGEATPELPYIEGPDSFPVGQDVVFRIYHDKEASGWHEVSVFTADGEFVDHGVGYEGDPSGVIQWNVFGSELEPGEYTIYFDGWGYTSKTFTITGERPAAPTVSMPAASGELLDVLTAVVTAPGMTQALWSEDPVYGSPVCYSADGDTARIPIPINFFGTQKAYFRAMIGGIWSKWSEPVTLTCTSEKPVLGDLEVDWPETIVPGQDVVISLHPLEGASSYHLYVCTEWNEYDMPCPLFDGSVEPGRIVLPAYYFLDGCSGAVFSFTAYSPLNAASADSYREYKIAPAERSPVTLTAQPLNNPVLADENLRIRISVSDPEAVCVLRSDWEITNALYSEAFSGDLVEVPLRWGESDTRYRIAVRVDGLWTNWVDMQITAEPRSSTPKIGDLEQAVPNAPSAVALGMPLTVQWEAVEHAETYAVTAAQIDGSLTLSAETNELQYTFADGLPEAGVWRIEVVPQAESYYSPMAYNRVYAAVTAVPDPRTAENALHLPAGLLTLGAEALEDTAAAAAILPKGCESIGSRAFALCKALKAVLIPSTVQSIAADAFDGCGALTVFTQAGSEAERYASSKGWMTVLIP